MNSIQQNFIILLGRLAGLFALAALGWTLRGKKLVSDETVRGLAWIVVDLTLPALIFIGIVDLSSSFGSVSGYLAAGLLVCLVGTVLGWLGTKLISIENKGTFVFSVAVANSSFLPLPLAAALWGDAGTAATVLFVIGNNIFLMSLGISLFQWDPGRKKKVDFSMIYRHPQSLAAVGGLLWRLTGWGLPTWLHGTLQGLGQSTIPMAMLATGGLLAASGGKMTANKAVLGLSLGLKLLGLPLLAVLTLKMLDIHGLLAGTVLLQAAMPSLASAAAYASRFDGDPLLAGNSSFWSSLVALGTIPAWMALGGVLGLF